MTAVFNTPISNFRSVATPAAGSKATVSVTLPTVTGAPSSTNFQQYMIVQNVTACLSGGTGANASLQVNLIDGTSGGTNVQWAGLLSNAAGASSNLVQNYLQIPITSGTATLEFASAPAAGSSQSVAISGYYTTYVG